MMRVDNPSWFTTQQIDGHLFLTAENHFFEGNRSNIWLIHGVARDLIIDCGLAVCNLKNHLANLRLLSKDRECIVLFIHSQVDDTWSSIPWISGENPQETSCFRPEPAGKCQKVDTRIRWPSRLPVLTGSCRFRVKPDKSGHQIRSLEYCFHEISGIPRNWPFPCRVVRHGFTFWP